MPDRVRILHVGFVTHDTRRFVVERPDGLEFEPGQGVEVAIARRGWEDEGRPFTPTSGLDDPVLELTVKQYPEHEGVTRELHRLTSGDELTVSAAFGTITYRGPGTFVAAGAGITPFLSILRDLGAHDELAGCRLLFSNKTAADVICEKELRHLLADRCELTLTRSRVETPGYEHRRIDRAYLAERIDDPDRPFYVCGPPSFVDDVRSALDDLGIDPGAVVFEE